MPPLAAKGAPSLPSIVVTVQSSDQMSYSMPPSVIIGSMVKVIPGSITVSTDGSS